ncbi:MAG TPA: serine protease [Acidimicrobiales bacterium]
MSLNSSMINTAVEIRDSPDNAIGTGFLMSVRGETNPSNTRPYVLTAEHVIRGDAEIYVAAANPNKNGELYEPVLVPDWFQPIPKLDLAVAPWPYKPLTPYSSIAMEKNLYPLNNEYVSLLGSPVNYIGLFAPARRMMVRSGTFGAVDAKGITHAQGFGYEYDCHLIDCRSYYGFSGSPCFVELLFIQREVVQADEVFIPRYRALMCGMFTEHYDDSEDPEINPEGAVSRLGVGVMVRGEDIKKALLCDRFVNDRAQRETDNLKRRGIR